MPLYSDTILICNTTIYQHLSPADHRIITTFTRSPYGKMYIRHKYHVSVTYISHRINHRTTQRGKLVSMKISRVSLVEIYNDRITFR